MAKKAKAPEHIPFGTGHLLGIMAFTFVVLFTLVGSLISDPAMFNREMFYFVVITFVLVAMIIIFEKLSFDAFWLDRWVGISIVVSIVLVIAMVSIGTYAQMATMMAYIPESSVTIYHLVFVGASEGIIQYFFIRLFMLRLNRWVSILLSAFVIVGLHWHSYGLSVAQIYVFTMFLALGLMTVLPNMMGSKIKVSMLPNIFGHATNNLMVATAGTFFSQGSIMLVLPMMLTVPIVGGMLWVSSRGR